MVAFGGGPARVIHVFHDGRRLEFDQGRFDAWCIYLVAPTGRRTVPRDADYFTDLAALTQRHPADQLYADFVAVYAATTPAIAPAVLEDIRARATGYGADTAQVEWVLTVLYAGMVAEECKVGTRLGKRIKRLGVHQVVVEGLPPAEAAVFSRGEPWRWLAEECRRRGF